MANQKLSLMEHLNGFKKRLDKAVKESLLNDVPPSEDYFSDYSVPSIRAVRAFNARYRLSEILPYESYAPKNELYFNRDTVGFVLHAKPATSLSVESLRTLNSLFNQKHRKDTDIQVSLVASTCIEEGLTAWQKNKRSSSNNVIHNIVGLMTQSRIDFLKKSKWSSLFYDEAVLARDMHLIVSYTIPIDEHTEVSQADEDFLVRMRAATIGTLRSANIVAQSMQPSAFISLLSSIINPSECEAPSLQHDEHNLISRQVVDAETMMLFGSGVSSIVAKESAYSVQTHHVRQFPKMWAGTKNYDLFGSFSNAILRLPCPFIITLNINVPEQLDARSKASRMFIKATRMSDSPISKYVPQWKQRKKDWEFTKNKVENGNKLFDGFYQIALFCPSGREEECEQSLKNIYDSLGWLITKSRYTPMHSFLSVLPMGLCQQTKRSLKLFGHYKTLLSWSCTNIAPWIGEWKGSSVPTMMFLGRRGQLTFFDPFSNGGNFNMSCCATSGAGKSVFTQEWVFSILASGGMAFVIDAGHSYRNLCNLIGGEYLDFGETRDRKIFNPFTTIRDDDPEFFEQQLPLLKMLICQMASPQADLNSIQTSVMEKAIAATWDKHHAKSTISDVIAQLLEHSSAHEQDIAQELATMLHPYSSTGVYGKFFDGPANVDLNHPFVVLDLDALNNTPDLQATVLLILMMRITQVMYLSGDKSKRKLCIIDEAWRILRAGRAGNFIEEGYRVARKHGGSFMTVTQKISDYYSSPVATAAIQNSDYTIFLKQKPEELRIAEEKNYISNADGKISILESLKTTSKYSELAISTPEGMSVVRFIVDPLSLKIYSTDASDVEFIQTQVKQGVPLIEAIHQRVQQSNA